MERNRDRLGHFFFTQMVQITQTTTTDILMLIWFELGMREFRFFYDCKINDLYQNKHFL